MVKKMGMPPKGSTMGNSARNVAAAEAGRVRRKWPRAWAEVMLPIPFQRLGRPVERRSQCRQLLARGLAVALVQSLVHARNHDRRITGIFAGRIDGVSKPGTVRQSLRREQRAFGAAQGLVQRGDITRRILLPREDLGSRGLKVAGSGVHRAEVEHVSAELRLR